MFFLWEISDRSLTAEYAKLCVACYRGCSKIDLQVLKRQGTTVAQNINSQADMAYRSKITFFMTILYHEKAWVNSGLHQTPQGSESQDNERHII